MYQQHHFCVKKIYITSKLIEAPNHDIVCLEENTVFQIMRIACETN